jgi:hypothetical protein
MTGRDTVTRGRGRGLGELTGMINFCGNGYIINIILRVFRGYTLWEESMYIIEYYNAHYWLYPKIAMQMQEV